MTSQPKVSVVVPIYKVERYLRQCVDSILAQTLREIEVILVDDGSPDACPRIVDEYATRDPRVKAIHQPNGGYGRAVNHGISVAVSPYIGIVESDDWIEPSMYEELYARAIETGSDIVKAEFYKYDSTKAAGKQDEIWSSPLQNLDLAPDEPFCPLDYEPIFFFHASLWSNLYKAELLRSVPMVESSGAAYQDFPFVMEILARAHCMSVVKKPLVHYRMEQGQGSSTMCRTARLIQMPIMSQRGREALISLGVFSHVKEAFYYHAFLASLGFFQNIDKPYRKSFFEEYHRLLAPTLTDPGFTFRYFTPDEARIAKLIAAGHYRHFFINNLFYKRTLCKTTFKFFGLPVFSINRKNGCVVYRLFCLRLLKRKLD